MGCFGCFGRRAQPTLYSERLRDRHIRVLELLPGKSSDSINCHLHEVKLGEAQFEALSYVWGDPKQTTDVQCNGNTIAITINLAAALRRIRLPNTSRFVWADAVCINQSDLVERAEQVKLMGEIYTLALPVTIWLGHGNDGSPELVKELLTKLDVWRTHLQERGFYNWPTLKPYPTTGSNDSEVLGDERMWRALGELFSAPWFSRIWCVQEVVLARGASFLFGNVQIDWNDLACLAWELNRRDPANDSAAPDYVKAVDYSKAYGMATTQAGEQVLERTLHSFRNWQATDARDKVFGILGLLQVAEWEEDVQVDYLKSIEDVYKDVATSSLRRNNSLAILSYVEHGPAFNGTSAEMSSWVPQWTTQKPTRMIARDPLAPHWSASGGRTDPKHRLINNSSLALHGAVVDTVTKIDTTTDSATLSASSPFPGAHPVLQLWTHLLPHATVPAEARPIVIRLCHTLALGVDIDMECNISDCNPEDLEEQDRFSRDFLPYIKRLFEVAGQEPPNTDAVYDNIPGSWDNFATLISQVIAGYRIFHTQSGKFGIGPACMAEGDVVALLWGGTVPYVLRSCSGKGAADVFGSEESVADHAYWFLGECYVDEFMDGVFADSEVVAEREILLV